MGGLMAKKPAVFPENCRQCRFLQLDHARNEAGYCRRYPPVLIGGDDEAMFCFPIVAVDEWCGEFKAVSQ